MNISRTPPKTVAVIGGCGIGLTLKTERVPAAGETVSGATFSAGEGGKGSNQAIAIARLGHRSFLISIVGPDDNGHRLRTLWRNEGVDDASVSVGTDATMVGAILVEETGVNRIVVAPGSLNELSADEVEAAADRIDAADALLASLEIPLDAAAAALRRASRASIPCVLNPAPARPLPPSALAVIDHLVPNESEAAALVGAPADASPDALADALRRTFDGTIVITLGEQGALVDANGAREHIDAIAVEPVVDSTGAGDAFTAAYTVATVEGAEPVEAARFAARAGAFAVTRDEVIPALPTRTELDMALTAAG
jgi:ribokinase